jgi:hypothetical protein
MIFGEAFSFQQRDPDWLKKIGFASLFALLGVTTPAVYGWMMEIFRRQAHGQQDLPNILDDFGKYFIDGLKIGGVSLLWMLPAILVYGCGVISMVLTADNPDTQSLGAVAIAVSLCIFIPYVTVVSLLVQPMSIILTQTNSFAAALNPLKSLALFRKNIGGFLLGNIVGGLISSVLMSIGLIACFIGVYPAMAYGLSGQAHLLNQAYQKAGGDAALEQL